MAILLFIGGVGITFQTFRTNKHVEAQVAGAASNTEENPNDEDADVPSETEPTADQFNNYQVAPEAPRYLRIPDSNVFARVYGLGVGQAGDLRAPNNIHNVGWYNKSALPGKPGAVLIDGHYSGIRGRAVFSELKNLKPGSRIEIERGDGVKIKYRVVSIDSYPKEKLDMKKAVTSVEPGVNGLNLITCDGHFDAANKTFDNRLLVRAVQE